MFEVNGKEVLARGKKNRKVEAIGILKQINPNKITVEFDSEKEQHHVFSSIDPFFLNIPKGYYILNGNELVDKKFKEDNKTLRIMINREGIISRLKRIFYDYIFYEEMEDSQMLEHFEITNLPEEVAAEILVNMNKDKGVEIYHEKLRKQKFIISKEDPKNLIYPKGWNLKDGELSNEDSSEEEHVSGMQFIKTDNKHDMWKHSCKEVKTKDIDSLESAIILLIYLNPEVFFDIAKSETRPATFIVTNKDPMLLTYIEGWEYRDGSDTKIDGEASQAFFVTPDHEYWDYYLNADI